MRGIHGVLLAACAVGLAMLVATSGVHELWQDATRLGWTVAAIVVLFGVEHAIRTVAWWCCYRPASRPPPWRLFWARLAGYAVNTTTPSATLVGEVTRAGLMRQNVPTLDTMTAISVDRLADTLADCSIGLCGLVVILSHAPFPLAARLGLVAAAALLGVGVGTFFLLQRRGRLAAVLTKRTSLGRLLGNRLAGYLARSGQALDAHLQAFHADRPAAFAAAFGLHLLGTSVAAVQIACFLHGLGRPVDVNVVLEIFVVAVALDLFSFFVPARLGAQEGARIVALMVAGLPARLGLLYSLVLRVEQLSWAAVGFLAYVRLAPTATATERVVPGSSAAVRGLDR